MPSFWHFIYLLIHFRLSEFKLKLDIEAKMSIAMTHSVKDGLELQIKLKHHEHGVGSRYQKDLILIGRQIRGRKELKMILKK